jgi:hypothetical protein
LPSKSHETIPLKKPNSKEYLHFTELKNVINTYVKSIEKAGWWQVKLSTSREGAENSLTVQHAYCLARDQANLFACLKAANYHVTQLRFHSTGWKKVNTFRKESLVTVQYVL